MAEPTPEATEKPAPKPRTVVWLLAAAGVILISAVAGFGVGMLLRSAGPSPAGAAPPPTTYPGEAGAPGRDGTFDYIDLDPITGNLNEPRLARYVRAAVTLAVHKDHAKEAIELVGKKKPELKNWLTVYLAGCSIEDVRGRENLNRLRREVQDSFNEQLWPDRKPVIDHVLFREFAVQ